MKRSNYLRQASVLLMIGLACGPARDAAAIGQYQALIEAEEREAKIAAAAAEKIDRELSAAQSHVVAGNLDAGRQGLEKVRTADMTAEQAARVSFLDGLIEFCTAEKRGEHGKLQAALAEAIHRADRPDELTACWQVGLAVSRKAVAAKQPHATGLIDLLSKGPAAAIGQFGPYLQIARLRIVLGSAGAAEAELRSAARCARWPCEWLAWARQVAALATLVGRGERLRDAERVFDRLREEARPAAAAWHVARGRFLLARGQLAEAGAALDRALQEAEDEETKAAALELNYPLAEAWREAGDAERAEQRLQKAEQAAQAGPVSAAMDAVREARLMSPEQAERAADAGWKEAFNTEVPRQRERALSDDGPAAVVAGHSVQRILDQLQSIKAGPAVYVAAAEAFLGRRAWQAAGEVLGAVPPKAVVADVKLAEDVAAMMRRVHRGRQHVAASEAARCRAIAGEFRAAAEKAEQAKDAKLAENLDRQAAAFQDLANQVEK